MFRIRRWLSMALVLLGVGLPAHAEVTAEQRNALAETMLAEIVKVHGPPQPLSREEAAAQVFYSLAQHAGRQDIAYRLSIIDKDVVNAYALPDGQVVFFTGLLNALPADDPDPIAFVAAHEIAHVEHRHAERRFENTLATGIIFSIIELAVSRKSRGWVSALGGVGFELITSGYSRDMEAEADQKALDLMAAANYEPDGALVVFKLFEQSSSAEFFPTHPRPKDRYKDTLAWLESHGCMSPYAVLAADPSPLAEELAQIGSLAGHLSGRSQGTDQQALVGLRDQACSLRRALLLQDSAAGARLDSLLAHRQAWSGAAPRSNEKGQELAGRLEGLERKFLHWQARRCEVLSQYLWSQLQAAPSDSDQEDAQARLGLLGVAESSRNLRIALEEGASDVGPQLQLFLANRALWSDTQQMLSLDPRFQKLPQGLGMELASIDQAYVRFAGRMPPPVAYQEPNRTSTVSSPPASMPASASSLASGTDWLPRPDFGLLSPTQLKRGSYLVEWEDRLAQDLQDRLGEHLTVTPDLRRRARSITYSSETSRADDHVMLLVYLVDNRWTYEVFLEQLERDVLPHLESEALSSFGVGVKQNWAGKKHIVILLERDR